MELFDESFNHVLINANTKYRLRKERYADSWQNCDVSFLEMRLKQELTEFNTSESIVDRYNESLDCINLMLMIAEKLRRKV